MNRIELVGAIVKKRADNLGDEEITKQLIGQGEVDFLIKKAYEAIDKDVILVIHSIPLFTFISPITYKIGVRKIEKETKVFFGLFRNKVEVAVRTIDRVNVIKNLFTADVAILHSGESQITITDITRKDAEKIRLMYSFVIEAQRKNIVNITQD